MDRTRGRKSQPATNTSAWIGGRPGVLVVISGSSIPAPRADIVRSSDVADHRPHPLLPGSGQLPVFAFALRDDAGDFSVYDVSDALRMRGWIVPAYRMPPAIDDLAVMRVCVRNGFSRDLGVDAARGPRARRHARE